MLFFRDSLLITVILITETVIIFGLKSCTNNIPDRASSVITFLKDSRLGRYFMAKHLVRNVSMTKLFQSTIYAANGNLSPIFCRTILKRLLLTTTLTLLNLNQMQNERSIIRPTPGVHSLMWSIALLSLLLVDFTWLLQSAYCPNNFSTRRMSAQFKLWAINICFMFHFNLNAMKESLAMYFEDWQN